MTDLYVLRTRLLMMLTDYDRQQSKKRGYNPYALAMYMNALCGAFDCLDTVSTDTEIRVALANHFEGRLLDKLLKLVGKAK